jgi:hypothetical protein
MCALCACAGNGEGLDSNGRPVTGGGGGEQPLVPELQSIQEHVFTPICTACHIGASAPLGFRLDADSAFAMLVNTPSAEVPSLSRVNPGNPDSSYLIQKLEGHAAVGAQMPLGQTPLPQATINVIRQWITDGAQPAAAGVSAPAALKIRAIAPLQEESLEVAPREILLAASGELDVGSLDASSVSLQRSGADGGFAEGNEVPIQNVQITVRSLDPTVLALTLTDGAWVPDTYQLNIAGHGATPATSRSGAPIADFILQFNVGAAR